MDRIIEREEQVQNFKDEKQILLQNLAAVANELTSSVNQASEYYQGRSQLVTQFFP